MFYRLKSYFLYKKIKQDTTFNLVEYMRKNGYDTTFSEYFISYLWNKDSNTIKNDNNILQNFFSSYYSFIENDAEKPTFLLPHFIVVFANYINNKDMSDYYFNLYFKDKTLSYFDFFMFMYCTKFFYFGDNGKIDPNVDKFKTYIFNYFHSQSKTIDTSFKHRRLSLLLSHYLDTHEENIEENKFKKTFERFHSLSEKNKNRVLYEAYHNYFYHRLTKKISSFFKIEMHYFKLLIGEPLHITGKILEIYPGYNLQYHFDQKNSLFEDVSEYIEYLSKGKRSHMTPIFGHCMVNIFEHISVSNENVEKMKQLFDRPLFSDISNFSIFKAKCEQLDLNKIIDLDIKVKPYKKKRL